MYKLLVTWIRKTVGISKTEINGYSVLILLFIVVHFGVTRYPDNTQLQFDRDENNDSIWAVLQSLDPRKPNRLTLSPFDPNTITYDSMIGMGFQSSIANNVIRYREAGGSFSTPADLRKIYGISDSLWILIKPWVMVESIGNPTNNSTVQVTSKKSSPQPQPVGINIADSIWFQSIYGIGPVLSARIVKYRELLGGFVSLDQLEEVYGLSPAVINELKGKVRLDTINGSIRKLHINTDDYKILGRHPYLSFHLGKAIISYRESHGPFDSIEEIKKIHLIDDSTYLRVRPYLDF